MENTTKKYTKPLKILENIITFVAFCLVIFLLLSMFLPKFGYNLIIIRSGSMEPAIKTGSVLVTKKQNDYSKGEVITFKNTNNEIVTHRIMETSSNSGETQFKTKGDNNDTDDMFLVKKEFVIGKKFFALPYFGYIISFAKTPWGTVIFFIFPAIWIAFEEVRKIKQELNHRKNKINEKNQ